MSLARQAGRAVALLVLASTAQAMPLDQPRWYEPLEALGRAAVAIGCQQSQGLLRVSPTDEIGGATVRLMLARWVGLVCGH